MSETSGVAGHHPALQIAVGEIAQVCGVALVGQGSHVEAEFGRLQQGNLTEVVTNISFEGGEATALASAFSTEICIPATSCPRNLTNQDTLKYVYRGFTRSRYY
ncbi:hypothetical protein [Xylella taiwanensis]|uniref:Uncharacterized protein n=1 Tax=Xylella taiwanensis TaxID=1444770 RepID=Z9JMF2_9GAMM|nr:hypothetical protein AF72_03435 [Xylella taiwanensis]